MHECPDCFQVCDCDGEDTWFDYPAACMHDCRDYEYDDYYQDEDEDCGPYDDTDYYVPPTRWQMVKYRVKTFILYLFHRCACCHKVDYFLGIEIGRHAECNEVPF